MPERAAPAPEAAAEEPATAEAEGSTEPAVEELAVAPAPVGASPDEETPGLAETRARWQEIYQRARQLHYRTGALLNSGCGIIRASEEEIVFGFRHTMLLDRMEADGGENLRALQQAVDDVLGPGRTVRCVLAPNVEVQRPGRGGHLVRAAEELGGQVLPDDG